MNVSMPNQAVCFRIVVASEAEAHSLSVEMLKDKVAYSASIHPNTETHYIKEDGTIQSETECIIEAYTDRSIMLKTAKWLQTHIKDDIPQVSIFAILDADDRYLQKINSILILDTKEI